MKKKAWIGMSVLALTLSWSLQATAAVTPDEVRGGWIADPEGQRHIYLLSVRGTAVLGIYCWDCSNPDNLAFVLDGKLEADGFSFVLLHDAGPGAPYRENVKGRLADGRLMVTSQRQNSSAPAKQMT